MKIWREEGGGMALSEFNSLCRHLLHEIVGSADPDGNPDVLGRLYSTPTGGAEPEFDREWQELVGSDLREHLDSATDLVRRDLAQLDRQTAHPTEILRIPRNHLDAWINVLNQARLAIAARHRFTDRDLESAPPENHPHALALVQMQFYGLLQERFLHELDEGE